MTTVFHPIFDERQVFRSITAALGRSPTPIEVYLSADNTAVSCAHAIVVPMRREDNADYRLGFLHHEIAHIRFTNFDLIPEDPALRDMWNAIEDPRVERLYGREYPGALRHLNKLVHWAKSQGLFTPRQPTPVTAVTYYVLAQLRQQVNGGLLDLIDRNAQVALQLVSRRLLDQIDAILAHSWPASTAQAIEMATAILDLLQQEQSSQAGGQGEPDADPKEDDGTPPPMAEPADQTDAAADQAGAPESEASAQAGDQASPEAGAQDAKEEPGQANQETPGDAGGATPDPEDHANPPAETTQGDEPGNPDPETRDTGEGGAASGNPDDNRAHPTAATHKDEAGEPDSPSANASRSAAAEPAQPGEPIPAPGSGTADSNPPAAPEPAAGEGGDDMTSTTAPAGAGTSANWEATGEVPDLGRLLAQELGWTLGKKMPDPAVILSVVRNDGGASEPALPVSRHVVRQISSSVEDMLSGRVRKPARLSHSGRLSTQHIAGLFTGEPAFLRKSVVDGRNTHLILLLDQSGSTAKEVNGKTILAAGQETAMAIMSACQSLEEAQVSCVAYCQNEMTQLQLTTVTLRSPLLAPTGSTPTGAAMRAAASAFDPVLDRHVLVVITDGEPDEPHRDDTTALERQGIEVLGLGIEVPSQVMAANFDRYAVTTHHRVSQAIATLATRILQAT